MTENQMVDIEQKSNKVQTNQQSTIKIINPQEPQHTLNIPKMMDPISQQDMNEDLRIKFCMHTEKSEQMNQIQQNKAVCLTCWKNKEDFRTLLKKNQDYEKQIKLLLYQREEKEQKIKELQRDKYYSKLLINNSLITIRSLGMKMIRLRQKQGISEQVKSKLQSMQEELQFQEKQLQKDQN